MKPNTVIECRGWIHAVETLREHGIEFDRAYDVLISERTPFGMERLTNGIHIYFNQGDDLNVAYYTPLTDFLCILNKPRVDGTPMEKRRKIKSSVCELY